jgi:dissimilatory sulfite reductase (desulfoviridin) alpha/beta subunit
VIRNGARGFHVLVGGGLGAVPHEAQLYTTFLPESELLPFSHAVLRVFAKHGEKKRRARARLKFLVAAWGIERFRAEVEAERQALREDPLWTAHLSPDSIWIDQPVHPPGPTEVVSEDAELVTWLRTATHVQRQPGYRAVQVRVPRGDLSPRQLRGLAALLREHTGDTLRIGADQSLWIRWVPTDRLARLRQDLDLLGLGEARPGGLGDTVTCPGADTCKLGITSPRSLARAIQADLDALATDPRLEGLRIHVSGCPNSCARHHVADIGFFGAAKTVEGVTAPHFMLLLGGLAGGLHHREQGDGFGTTILKLPAARIATAVQRLTTAYLEHAAEDEAFGVFARRLGRRWFQDLLRDLTQLPSPSEAPELYREHGRDGAFRVVRGTGECAGAVVLQGDLLLMEADRHADRATGKLDERASEAVVRHAALAAFQAAARALLSTQHLTDVPDDQLSSSFRRHIYEPGRIYEGVGHYFFQAHEDPAELSPDRLRRLVVEAGLFVEEAHSIHGRLQNPAEVSR